MPGPGDPPAAVAAVLDGFPEPQRARLLELRALIFEVADAEGVGPLTETLKWGEPAYLTEATGAGTTVRLGIPKGATESAALFVSCQSRLIDRVRAECPDLTCVGSRAIHVPLAGPLPPLARAIGLALTYKRWR